MLPELRSLRRLGLLIGLAVILTSTSLAQSPTPRKWKVEGVEREGLVYVPAQATSKPTPIVFAFHGHGGSMTTASRSFAYHTHWPEAISVYLQGLNTPSRLVDPEGKKSGWQNLLGEQNDRDLAFFDAVLASLKQDYKIDERRIYATGHSNGGGFTYLLWAARGEVFAAFAPSAAASLRQLKLLKPKPVLHVAGETDELVKFAWQERTIDALREINQCEEGRPWSGEKWCTLYPSKLDTPVVTCIHPGGHTFLREAPPLIVKFFKGQAKR